MVTFKTRARTIDMLGRQQIAGIPTAISELFKNAHDAYADRVEVDYYRSNGLFVLRDDGIGMSKDEFLNRWLTIGTESKYDPAQSLPIDPDKDTRPVLGEKGIGRLAIAAIGPQLLVLTRPKTDKDNSSDLTVAFLNWGVFEWPGINLEEVHIPIRSFPPETLPSAKDVTEMVEEFRQNALKIGQNVGKELVEKLTQELDQFDIDPQHIDSYLKSPSLLGNGCGTHFIIKPSSPLLAEDIDGDLTVSKSSIRGKSPLLIKVLLGFSNTMVPGSQKVIHTAFRDHKTDIESEDLIGENEFFTQEEFETADHRIRGEFDKFGQFRGRISIYGEEISDHIIPWSGSHGMPTECGPFTIDIAAFEGENRYSKIPHEEHARLANKTGRLGGLYIYRNGIRVLPYGETEYDWLEIELRRTKHTGYYYFSHRKMFGAIEIDAEKNSALQEKAGREGFQKNRAYRQFQSILQKFLIQMAADFFRTEGMHTENFNMRKSELSKEDEARRRREKQVLERKKKFKENLNIFFNNLANGTPNQEVQQLTERVEKELQLLRSNPDRQLVAHKILELEGRAQEQLRELETNYRISRPRIGLSKAMLRDWKAYNLEFISLQKNVFQPAYGLIENIIGEEASKARLSLDRRIRIESVLEDIGKMAHKSIRDSAGLVETEANKVLSEASDATGRSMKTVESEVREVLSELQRVDITALPEDRFVEKRSAFESRIVKTMEAQKELLQSVLDQLKAIDMTGKSSTAEQLMAIEQRNILLEEESEADAELVQIGMAIEIINHEFSSTIRSIRIGLRRLKAWADVNTGLDKLYNSIRANFDHLDGYLALFTPLRSRLYRKEVEIYGFEIFDFLEELFRARLVRHSVTITATKAFRGARLVGFPSSFYPVFVNLVDNAIYWLSQQNPKQERGINLDEQEGTLLISDTGPGVGKRDQEAIFEFGFSRKPGGRGMGLHISRESLRRVGFNLKLIPGNRGATFGILPMETSSKKK